MMNGEKISAIYMGALDISKNKRWIVVLLLILALGGGYMFLYVLSPLQSLLEQQQGWSLVAYSRYSSAESFLNLFFCILLIAGLLVDRLGVRVSGLLSALLMVIGGGVNYYALTPSFSNSVLYTWIDGFMNIPDLWWNVTPFSSSMVPSAKLASVGFMLFGVGMEMAGVSASRATVRWFQGKELAVAMGLQLAGSRVMVALSLWLSPRMANSELGAGGVSTPVGLVMILIIIGVICWILYGLFGNEKSSIKKKDSMLKPLLSLCINKRSNHVLWVLAAICVTYYASLIPFYRYATVLFQDILGVDAVAAASVLASLPLVSALATPLVCLIPDFKGGSIWLMVSGCVFMIICYLSFAFILPAVPYLWLAYIGIAMLGLASAFVSAGLWPLIPKIVDGSVLGSAYASFYWLQSLGLYLVPLLVALVMGDNNDYRNAMILFAIIAFIALIGIYIIEVLNGKYKLGLNMPNRMNRA